ncbi:MAG TPA: hypothetical protein VGK30_17660 [Candidatus Binatia bacterium]|jgi:hypothetical protein
MRAHKRFGAAVVVAILVATLCLGTARPGLAEEQEEENFATGFGLGVGAVFVDLVYMPVKFVYATLGGLTGSLAYVLTAGRTETAMSIWRPSLGGTYVVTPRMLKGDEEIHFSGRAEPDARGSSRMHEEPVSEHPHPPGESY